MGRKNRRPLKTAGPAQSTTTEVPSKMPSKMRKKLDLLVDQLLHLCTTGGQDWGEYTRLCQILQKIQALEKDYNLPSNRREDHFNSFLAWLCLQGASWKSAEIAEFDEGGFGIRAKCNIEEDEQWLSVPRRVMLTTETARNSKLGSFVATDVVLQHMPNVMLALHLLNERCDPQSFWTDYINILPEEYDTPMYFTMNELSQLKGSPVLDESIKQCRNIARQYAYFYRLFKSHSGPDQDLPLKNFFTYNSYRWAVSAVMTRQNSIPSPGGSTQLLALVPLWDLCNHTNGKLATDYNLEKDQIESHACRSFQSGEQVFMFYGVRSNADLFIHNGFVYPENEHDCVMVKVDLRKSDPLYNRKEELLTRLGISTSGVFPISRGEHPIDGSLLAFNRVAVMSEEMLEECLRDERWRRLTEVDVGVELAATECLCWKLLKTRIAHLLGSYPTSLQADELLLSMDVPSETLSARSSIAVRLRLLEKRILEGAVRYIEQRQDKTGVKTE